MKGIAFQCGALVLVAVPMTLLEAAWSGEQGHLPWPALQWTVTTPVGALVLMALFLLAVGPPGILLNRWQLRREVGRAVDVTDVPPAAWPGLRQARPQQPVLQRWLGNGRCQQAISLVLLVLGMLLAAVLVGVFVASAIYGFSGHGRVQCAANGCPPLFPVSSIAMTSVFAAITLSFLAQYRWLRRVEATSRVWLRYRTSLWMAPRYYLRQPGVTPEAAAAALARFTPSLAVPLARRFFIAVLAGTPALLLVSLSFALTVWLQLRWLSG